MATSWTSQGSALALALCTSQELLYTPRTLWNTSDSHMQPHEGEKRHNAVSDIAALNKTSKVRQGYIAKTSKTIKHLPGPADRIKIRKTPLVLVTQPAWLREGVT